MLLACGACSGSREAPKPIATASAESSAAPAVAKPVERPVRQRIDGRAFPSKVLALTWDDGPDVGTAELARYLHDQHVAATFFVVEAWVSGVSSDPGEGRGVYETGHAAIDVLGTITSLGHRVANHTKNHVLLGDAPAAVVREQLGANQRRIDRFVHPDLRLFRAPGGAWSPEASTAIDEDPFTATLVGPVHWDIDGKDWEGSLYCPSDRPAGECEAAAPGGARRLKVEIVAKRYLELADAIDHGIVLFHDRVGHVGSDYARRIARIVIPELKRRGFVFAAPVVRFGRLEPHEHQARAVAAADRARLGSSEVQTGDVDGDGSPDRCVARMVGLGKNYVTCDLTGASTATSSTVWWRSDDVHLGTMQLGDINGDGRADLCAATSDGRVTCALSDGHRFLEGSVWLEATPGAHRFELVDVNGDGRADLCVGGSCALAP